MGAAQSVGDRARIRGWIQRFRRGYVVLDDVDAPPEEGFVSPALVEMEDPDEFELPVEPQPPPVSPLGRATDDENDPVPREQRPWEMLQWWHRWRVW